MDLISWICLIIAGLFMAYAAWVDWRTHTIPYASIIVVALTGLVWRYQMGSPMGEVILMALVIGLVILISSRLMSYLRGKEMLGYGDIRLMVASLIWIDLHQVPMFLIIAGLAGVILGILYRGYFPFAPGIGIAWIISVFL